MELTAEWSPPKAVIATPKDENTDLTKTLLALLARPGTRSSEDIVRRYDTEVQGGTVVKPFVGPGGYGPGDAAVIAPQDTWRAGSKQGVALSVGMNVALGKIDPYAMAWAAVDEAVRNCVAVGADPDRIAILDNFCWGNPRLPDRLGSLVRCCEGCHDAALAYGTPFVSGKDSLNNEFLGADGKKHAIPGTLLISAMGIVPDVTKSVTSDFKAAGNLIYVIGDTRDELPGTVPALPANPLETYRALHRAMTQGLIKAAHDCSDGGLLPAIAEMALGGALGAEVALDLVLSDGARPSPNALAFSESLGRIVVEVTLDDQAAFQAAMHGSPLAFIGTVTNRTRLKVMAAGTKVVDVTLTMLTEAFRGHLAEAA